MLEVDPHILTSRNLTLDCRPANESGGHVMGVLNVTPDSFSDGGQFDSVPRAVERAQEMAAQGAAIIDIGGASSRPKGASYGKGAELVSAQEEMDRILPVVQRVASLMPDTWISIDTFRSDVANEALRCGAHMINDITALRFDPSIATVCAQHQAPIALMHSVGMPGDMPHLMDHDNVVEEVISALSEAVAEARRKGCKHIVLDPGFGFGKSHTNNLMLISQLSKLKRLGCPILIGVSRKSTVGHVLANGGDTPPPLDRLFGSLAITSVGLQEGAMLVRTHDIRETANFLRVFGATRSTSEA
ncbi:MAG: dihydropteroate synthase [Rhodothermales bacterium]|nr:dihydropteroate synthase [Rhodothermales bacterium]MDG2016137.1 dihydropteroate synthase [Rhodothermales bacterium]HAY35940.1 dihydropteroate synthase [Bacteroidota bacterium]